MAEYLYIHIPYCVSKCAYCDFYSVPCKEKFAGVPDSYVAALCNEIKFRLSEGPDFNEKSQFCSPVLKSVYVGGGTPSILKFQQIQTLFNVIKPFLKNDAEVSFEVNPEDVTKELLFCLDSAGVNRISCGIQSMNQKVLDFAGRRGSSEKNKEVLSLFNEDWHKKLSLDFISGLPFETEESLLNGLELAVKIKPSHISLYSLVVEEETPLGKKIDSGEIPFDFDFSDKLWLCGKEFLESKGYSQYEISNFCLPGKESIHNMAYWTRKSYYGCGSGATGTLYNNDGTALRFTNSRNLQEYIDFWQKENFYAGIATGGGDGASESEMISSFLDSVPGEKEIVNIEDSKFEFFMMGLRKLSGITKNEYESYFFEEFPQKVENLFKEWQQKGLATIELCSCASESCVKNDTRYSLNSKGILFLNKFLELL